MDPLGPHSPVPSDAASLTAPIVLLLLALSSAAYLSHTLRATPIALPTSTSDGLQPDPSSEKVKQVDVEISPSSFYPHQRVRKLLFVGAAVGCEAVALFELARSASRGEGGWESSALMTAFYAVVLGLALASAPLENSRADIDRHWALTIVSTILTFTSFSTTILQLILPSSSRSMDAPKTVIDITLDVLTVSFQGAAFLVVGTTDKCAPLGKAVDFSPVSSFGSCSPVSYLLFSWISPVLATGAKVVSLSADDLPYLGANDRADNLWDSFRSEQGKKGPRWINPLLWRCLKVNRRMFYWQSFLALVTSFLYYLPAFFLQKFILFLEAAPAVDPNSQPRSLAWGYAYCLGLFSAGVLDAIVSGQLWFISNSLLATRLRTQLNCLIFDKTLKRKDVAGVSASNKPSTVAVATEDGKPKDDLFSGEGKEEENFGSKSQVLNLFTIDVDRVADFSIWCFSVIDAPAEIIIGTFFLYRLLGYAAFVGLSVAVLFLPINHWTSKAFADVQDRLMSARDKRVSLMNEVLQSVRMIKYLAFEKPFEERILVTRNEELKHLRHNFLLEVSFNAIWSASPILCVLVSFYVYTKVMGQELTPSTAFASLAVWNELRFALNCVPDTLVQAIQCIVSLRRIEAYLNSDEVNDEEDTRLGVPPPSEEGQEVAFRNATVTWPSMKDVKVVYEVGAATPKNAFELQDIDVKFPTHKMSLVCGSLGSGKTLLLLALLGEADVLAGQVICPHSAPDAISLPNIEWDKLLNDGNWIQPSRTAYVPQSAWLQNATIKNNILFGLPLREDRYKAVLEACSLVTDLEILEDGDSTEIGEKGINLSGGQKARVSLARAVYSRASLLLLDDVLSAVDAHTAQHIFNNCLKGPLMVGRTIVLVSHHIQLCAPGVDYVISLENGRVKFGGPAADFLATDRFRVDEEDEIIEAALAAKSPVKAKNKLLDLVSATTAASSEASSASEAESDSESESDDDEFTKEKPARKLIEDEARAVGMVDASVWKLYLGLSGGVFFWMSFVITFGGTKLADVAQTLWLSNWSGSYDSVDGSAPAHGVNYYLGIYSLLSFLGVFVGTLQWFVLYSGSLRASERLYRILLHSILRAPLRFFDTQALGRLLNRFGKDFEGVDAALPDHFGRSLMYGLGVFTTLAVIATVSPLFLVFFAFLSIAYFHYARLFSKTARELRRLDSVSKSPLYSIYGEAIAGVAVIRAFGSSQRFMTLMLERCSTNVTFYWYLWSVNRWLSIRFALLSAVVVALTGYVLLLAGDKIDAALAGFALTFSLNIANDILFLVRRYTALELAMVSVERIKDYAEVEQEAPEYLEPRPPAHWPHAGVIVVENLSIRYAPELPDVLHDLSFTVGSAQKVGIVGATGCGKSTLALSFFRFVEAWSGRILIDDIDISKVGLTDLRSNLSIIPQDPVILSGTLRSTVDIFSEYTDIEIFEALRRVHLIKSSGNDELQVGENRSPFYDLESEVAEGGANYSQGQRQLLCMARALLKRNRLLLLDEATASVDYETDEMISATIRQEFSSSTLLVIAHRLRTVIDFDKILVLDAGRIIEYDSPAKLIADPASRFHALCRASGKSEFRILKKMAEGKAVVAPKMGSRRKSGQIKSVRQ